MPELTNISYEIENDINIWFKVKIQLVKGESIWEVLSNDDQENILLAEIFNLVPMIRELSLAQFMSDTSKISMSDWTKLHSQVNQFVARHEFRNVETDDFLAQITIDGNKRKLNLSH